jgi:UTP-glucose-1-phosphate uridylyltransferase
MTGITEEQANRIVKKIAEIFHEESMGKGESFNVGNPLFAINQFLLWYADVLLDKDNGANITKDRVIEIYEEYHRGLIESLKSI